MTRQQTIIYFTIGVLNTFATIFSIEWLNYLTRPLLMLSLAFFYFKTSKNNSKLVDKALIIALIFSCLGDIFLIFDKNPYYFILGLGSFLLAHLSYIFVFSEKTKFNLLRVLLFATYGIFMLYYIMSHVSNAFKIPVFAYISIITLMGIMAASRKSNPKSYQLVLLGVILFAISDSLIGIDKFVNPIPFASFWIMTTYVTAQYFITKGILHGRD